MKLDKKTLTEEQQALEKEFGVSYYITKDKKLWLKTNKKYDAFVLKNQKKYEIDKLATLSDQLNLLAVNLNLVIDEVWKTNPIILTNPNVVQGKKILLWIQDILAWKKKAIPKPTTTKKTTII